MKEGGRSSIHCEPTTMSPSAPEDEGPQGRKRSRGGEERERSRRDEKERPERRRREGERDPRRSKRRGERDEREGDRDGSRWPRRRRFRDSIDASHPSDGGGKKNVISKTEEEKGEKKKADGSPPRSKSFFQDMLLARKIFKHDDRGSAGHGGRDVMHRAGEQGRRRNDSKEPGDRFRENRSTRDNPPRKDENIHAKMGEDSAWKHDGFFELETGVPPQRKRPAFREKKPEGLENPAPDSADLPPRHEKSGTGQDIREDGGAQHPRGRERFERSFAGAGNRDMRRAEGQHPRYGHQFRDRYYGGASGARGRERFGGRRFDGRSFHQPGGLQIEKWKHDLFEEANRSPTPKNDEDKLAKLESLLAS